MSNTAQLKSLAEIAYDAYVCGQKVRLDSWATLHDDERRIFERIARRIVSEVGLRNNIDLEKV